MKHFPQNSLFLSLCVCVFVFVSSQFPQTNSHNYLYIQQAQTISKHFPGILTSIDFITGFKPAGWWVFLSGISVLPVPEWVFSGCAGFLSQPKGMQIRPTGYFTLPCWPRVTCQGRLSPLAQSQLERASAFLLPLMYKRYRKQMDEQTFTAKPGQLCSYKALLHLVTKVSHVST